MLPLIIGARASEAGAQGSAYAARYVKPYVKRQKNDAGRKHTTSIEIVPIYQWLAADSNARYGDTTTVPKIAETIR